MNPADAHRYFTLDVFTDRPLSGNPLAVFPEGERVPEALLQPIARELNLSETVFVLPPERPRSAARLRIFTPAREIPFAGHPTIGTVHLLCTLGRIALATPRTEIQLDEGVGPVGIRVHSRDGEIGPVQLSPAHLPERGPTPPAVADLAALLGLLPDDLCNDDHAPEAWSCGLPFVFVPLHSADALARIEVRFDLWKRHLADFWARDVYVFAPGPNPDVDYRARMFAPGQGIAEDPATGSAVAAFAGYLTQRSKPAVAAHPVRIEQGLEMGRPSRLELEMELRDGRLSGVRVGGRSVVVGEGELRLAD